MVGALNPWLLGALVSWIVRDQRGQIEASGLPPEKLQQFSNVRYGLVEEERCVEMVLIIIMVIVNNIYSLLETCTQDKLVPLDGS